jgi:site-specific recombinase XerD
MTSKRDALGESSFWSVARTWLHLELPTVRQASPKTVESYRLSLECYLDYLAESLSVQRGSICFDCFEQKSIKGFLVWMRDVRSYAPKTRSVRLSAVKSFLAYAAQDDITLVALSEGAKAIRAPQVPKQPIEYLTRSATAALLQAPDTTTLKGRRNQMILITMYDTAARVSEAAGIRVCDLHLDMPAFVTLFGKGSKPRNVPLMDKTVSHLRAYLEEFHPKSSLSGDLTPLFYSNLKGKRNALSTDSISSIVKQCAVIASKQCSEMPEKIHCHIIRKTRAMDLYKEGVSLPIIMRLLGHESMSTTTTFYAFATMDMITKAIVETNSLSEAEPKLWKEAGYAKVLYSLK